MTTEFCETKYDRRKIFFHPRAIADLLETGDTWPVTVNTGFTTYCNHSCAWCSSAYTTRVSPTLKSRDELLIDPEVWIRTMKSLADRGTKGLIIAGQGEPLLHPVAHEMLDAVADTPLKFMLFSNGQRLSDKYFDGFFRSALAVRFSVDAGTEAMHSRWHAADSAQGKGRTDFSRVVKNIRHLVDEKRRRGTTLPHIGCQMVASVLTQADFEAFARLFREVGVDYIVYKSLQGNPTTRKIIATSTSLHETQAEREAVANAMLDQLWDIKKRYERPGFEVHVKHTQISEAYVKEFNGAEYYPVCRAHPLTPMIEPDGKVYVCIDHGGDDSMVMGNIYDHPIEKIWTSCQRRDVISRIDLKRKCPAGCFLHEANLILNRLANPDEELHWQLI